MPPTLPIELYAPILTHIESPRELARISSASRTFHGETMPHLLHTVTMRRDVPQQLTFYATLSVHPRWYLLIRSLSVRILPMRAAELLGETLPLMTNLRHLGLIRSDCPAITGRDWILPVPEKRHLVQLDSLDNRELGLGDILRFYESQPSIKSLKHSQSYTCNDVDAGSVPDHILPNLTILECDGDLITKFASSRPITHLKITLESTFAAEQEIIGALELFRSSLVSVCLDRSGRGVDREQDAPSIIASIGSKVPNIRRLTIWSDSVDVWDLWNGIDDGETLLHRFCFSFTHFHNLHTIIFDCSSLGWIDICFAANSPSEIAHAVMSKPWLKTLVVFAFLFHHKPDEQSDSDSEDYAMYRFVRASDGELQGEVVDQKELEEEWRSSI
ncbi:hypothetical protein JAAARDRAFT_34065 [Jaapia argillacea MUCL 33604]|uniref:F-box domain-containing protein n=1 Tax=Jaapia argillacea MUCL 33604 TaxID=933084 RepID=A0A067Q753_9AGAM|nr:hypothetical protein JAAARDRAFT_34065 [Jaapia argillacea MUCL 33604]